jgi:hypothetical protein
MVDELYYALRKAGVDEPTAKAAAEAVLGVKQGTELVTTPVLRAELEGIRRDMAELKADLIKWNVGAMAVLTAIFAAIVQLA